MKKILQIICFFSFLTSVYAEDINVTGRVIDINTGNWIQNAIVTLLYNNKVEKETVTLPDGSFILSLKKNKEYVLEVQSPKFNKYYQNVVVDNALIKDPFIKITLEKEDVVFSGRVFNTYTKAPLTNVYFYKLSNGLPAQLVEVNDKGDFSTTLLKNKVYELSFETGDIKFTPSRITINTSVIKTDFNRNFFLTPNNTSELATKTVEKQVPVEAKPVEKVIPKDTLVAEEKIIKEASLENYKKEEPKQEIVPAKIDETTELFVKQQSIYYPAGKALLNSQATGYLDDIIKSAKQALDKHIYIQVHSDTKEELAIEDYICKLRGEQIVSYLLQKEISFERIHLVLKGNKQPVNKCAPDVECSEAELQENRRADVYLMNKIEEE